MRPNYRCRTAELKKAQAFAEVVLEQHLHAEQALRQAQHQYDGQLYSSTQLS